MDISFRTHRDYLGKPLSSLPTPALVISRPVLEKNISRLLQNVSDLGISFRPHVKTLKVGWRHSWPPSILHHTYTFYPLSTESRSYTDGARWRQT